MLATMLLTSILAAPSTPATRNPNDVFFAYYVRTTVARQNQRTPSGPVSTSVVVSQGPWLNFSDALEQARENTSRGVCVVDTQPSLETPGHAVCYPVHLIQKVEVVSP